MQMQRLFYITDAFSGQSVIINLELVRERRVCKETGRVTFVFDRVHQVTSIERFEVLSETKAWSE